MAVELFSQGSGHERSSPADSLPMSRGRQRGLIKLVAPAVAVRAEVPVSALAEMIYAYPTFRRVIAGALRELR